MKNYFKGIWEDYKELYEITVTQLKSDIKTYSYVLGMIVGLLFVHILISPILKLLKGNK